MDNEQKKLKLSRRGEDNSKIISVRIKQSILEDIDRIASEANYSRNELINILLEFSIKNVEID